MPGDQKRREMISEGGQPEASADMRRWCVEISDKVNTLNSSTEISEYNMINNICTQRKLLVKYGELCLEIGVGIVMCKYMMYEIVCLNRF